MKRAIGAFVVLGIIGGAVWIELLVQKPQLDRGEPLRNAADAAREMRSPPYVTVNIPEGWSMDSFNNDLRFVTHVGFIASNIDHTFAYPDLGPNEATSAWHMRGLPDTLVAVEVSRNLRFPIVCRETDPFPRFMTDGEWSPGAYGSPRRLFIPACVEGRLPFGIHVWIGPDSTLRDRTDVQRLLASIQPVRSP